MDTQNIWYLETSGKSKGDLFKEPLKDVTFDYALPQEELDAMEKFAQNMGHKECTYNLILSTTVWVYPDGEFFGAPCTCCKEVAAMLTDYYINKSKGNYEWENLWDVLGVQS